MCSEHSANRIRFIGFSYIVTTYSKVVENVAVRTRDHPELRTYAISLRSKVRCVLSTDYWCNVNFATVRSSRLTSMVFAPTNVA